MLVHQYESIQKQLTALNTELKQKKAYLNIAETNYLNYINSLSDDNKKLIYQLNEYVNQEEKGRNVDLESEQIFL